MKQQTKIASTPIAKDGRLPKRIFLLSQAEKPKEIKKSLLDSAVSDGWISLIVNINTAIFVGLIALTADFGAIKSLSFLAFQLSFTFIGMVILLFLQIRRQSNRSVKPVATERLLTFIDLLLACSWGFGVIFFVSPLFYNRSLLIIVLLTASGIASAALNAKLLPALLLGRVMLFAPSVVYYLIEQPPFWGLLICTLFFAFAVTIGIGYAIHVQHLNEANLASKLRETSVLLEQQSFSLERSLLLEHEAQNRILKETKLREKFLHSISHDLNQPLSALGLYLNDLEQQKPPLKKRSVVLSAQQCLRSAKSLIRSVSQLAWIKEHLPPPDISAVELRPLMTRIVEEAQSVAANKAIEIVHVPTSLWIRADAEFLERVLRNLVHNAIQYTADGRVLFGVRRRAGGFAEISVVDTGAGISQKDQEHIFEAFFQTNEAKSRQSGNVGLGLSIVNDLVSAMDGQIVLKSTVNKGSRFGVVLPVVPEGASTNIQMVQASRDAWEADEDADKKLARVLFVEDQKDYLDTISSMLEELGYAVDCASKPAEIAKINADTLDQYRYLILDFDLGDGLTAFDVLGRSKTNLLPRCLIISQYDDPDMILRIKEKGGRFLKKPFETMDLEITLSVVEKNQPGFLPVT